MSFGQGGRQGAGGRRRSEAPSRPMSRSAPRRCTGWRSRAGVSPPGPRYTVDDGRSEDRVVRQQFIGMPMHLSASDGTAPTTRIEVWYTDTVATETDAFPAGATIQRGFHAHSVLAGSRVAGLRRRTRPAIAIRHQRTSHPGVRWHTLIEIAGNLGYRATGWTFDRLHGAALTAFAMAAAAAVPANGAIRNGYTDSARTNLTKTASALTGGRTVAAIECGIAVGGHRTALPIAVRGDRAAAHPWRASAAAGFRCAASAALQCETAVRFDLTTPTIACRGYQASANTRDAASTACVRRLAASAIQLPAAIVDQCAAAQTGGCARNRGNARTHMRRLRSARRPWRAIRAGTTIANAHASIVANELTGRAAERFAITGSVTTGVVATLGCGQATIGTACVHSIGTHALPVRSNLLARTGQGLGDRRWPARRIGRGCAPQTCQRGRVHQ